MARIQSLYQLEEKISQSTSKRKKIIHSLVATSNNNEQRLSAHVMMYAQYEGLVKEQAQYYLEYISYKKVPYSQLHKDLQALFVRSKVSGIDTVERFDKILESLSGIKFPSEGIIKTKSNLSSNVLKRILKNIAIPRENFAHLFVFINSSLLNVRNGIAHGEYRELSETEMKSTYNTLNKFIDSISDQILDHAKNEKYKS